MKGVKIIFIVIGIMMFSIIPVFAGDTAMPPPAPDTEDVSESSDTVTTTEESEITENSESMNQRIINNITHGGLGDYWKDSADRLSTSDEDVENGFFYKLLMRISNVCKRLFVFVVPLSIAIGAFIRVIAGMKKTWKKTGMAIIVAVPIIMIALAFGVPIASSIFYYGP